jgi:hypothetical protein
MPAKRNADATRRSARPPEHNDPGAVAAHLAGLAEPKRSLVAAVRSVVLSADPRITEGVKWNSASFYCHGWFATVRDNAKIGVQVVFHHGAKVKADAALGRSIDDPEGLLVWPSADRAVAAFASPDEFAARRTAFVSLVRQWAAYQAQATQDAAPGAA